MPAFICVTCGTQFTPSDAAPKGCPICLDERQFVPQTGQQWITPDGLRAGHFNAWRRHEPGLLGIGTQPAFAIGQRALLVRTPGGNVLWDCISLLDEATVELVGALGGIAAIAISHPHYYASMVEWAHAFEAPIWLHEADRAHVMRPDPAIRFWSGELHALMSGLTLINAPGHFDGATVLHWSGGAEGKGAARRRRAPGQSRWPPRQLHAQLSQLHPAFRLRSATPGGGDRAVFVRSYLRSLVAHRRSGGRACYGRAFRGPIPRVDRRSASGCAGLVKLLGRARGWRLRRQPLRRAPLLPHPRRKGQANKHAFRT